MSGPVAEVTGLTHAAELAGLGVEPVCIGVMLKDLADHD
jgi:hypothetical protein